MTSPAHVRITANSTLYLVTAARLTQIFQQCSTDSRGALSVGSHLPAIIFGPAWKEIATLERLAIKISFNFSRSRQNVMLAGIVGM